MTKRRDPRSISDIAVRLVLLAAGLCVVSVVPTIVLAFEKDPGRDPEAVDPPATVDEARERAKLLHETVHLLLHAVHRDLFNDDDASAIPSRSFEDMFESLADRHRVRLQWLVVETDIVNVDHVARSAFDKAAVEALRDGARSYEASADAEYLRVAAVDLPSQCLKCHVKNRTSLETRTAGLRISMPLDRERSKDPIEARD